MSRFINAAKDEQGSLAWKIVNKLEGIAKDVDDLKRQRDKTDREIERLKKLPVLGEEVAAEIARLEQERAALARLVGNIEGKGTLNVLTDEGLLPNYAFPEQGVLLRSIILRERKTGCPECGTLQRKRKDEEQYRTCIRSGSATICVASYSSPMWVMCIACYGWTTTMPPMCGRGGIG